MGGFTSEPCTHATKVPQCDTRQGAPQKRDTPQGAPHFAFFAFHFGICFFVFTTRIEFDGKRAVSVRYAKGRGAETRVFADEIICCGGAINSPQLLQLSGIGNPNDLEPLGIEIVQELPGVGENLQDHLEVYVQHACTQPVSMQPASCCGM